MSHDISLEDFAAIDQSGQASTYIDALEAFDKISELQELKQIGRSLLRPGDAVLDVGCGPGIETVTLARQAGSGARICGLDKSAAFIDEARRRASALGLAIDYVVGGAEALPWRAASFDHVRAERVLVYIDDVPAVLSEMHRVLKPGGGIALIEPQIDTAMVNVSDRALSRRVLAHEADTAVAQSWLPGRLPGLLDDCSFRNVASASRVLLMPQDLAMDYFLGAARKAADADAISSEEFEAWQGEIVGLRQARRLQGTIGYFLFMARW
jgi:SAM-dependent methyltransferase